MSSNVIVIQDSQFETEVLGNTGQPTLAYFWAPWCGPCRLVSPSVQAVANTYSDRLKVVKLEVDLNPQAVKLCQVEGVPALRLFRGGEIIASFEGAITKDKLIEWIDPHL